MDGQLILKTLDDQCRISLDPDRVVYSLGIRLKPKTEQIVSAYIGSQRQLVLIGNDNNIFVETESDETDNGATGSLKGFFNSKIGRYRASRFDIKIRREEAKKSLRVRFPKSAQQMSLIPNPRATLAVIYLKDAIEVWIPDKLVDYLSEITPEVLV